MLPRGNNIACGAPKFGKNQQPRKEYTGITGDLEALSGALYTQPQITNRASLI